MNPFEMALAAGVKKLTDARRRKEVEERRQREQREADLTQRWLGVQVAVDAVLGDLAPFRLPLERPDTFDLLCDHAYPAVRFPECASIYLHLTLAGTVWALTGWTDNGKGYRYRVPYPEREVSPAGSEFIRWDAAGNKVLRTSDLHLALAFAREAHERERDLNDEIAQRAARVVPPTGTLDAVLRDWLKRELNQVTA